MKTMTTKVSQECFKGLWIDMAIPKKLQLFTRLPAADVVAAKGDANALATQETP